MEADGTQCVLRTFSNYSGHLAHLGTLPLVVDELRVSDTLCLRPVDKILSILWNDTYDSTRAAGYR